MKPNLRNLFMKKLTRERVVPIIPANVSWLTFAITGSCLVFFAEVRQQKQHPGKTFLARIEQLIDQIRFNADGPAQKMRDEHSANAGSS